MLNNSSSATSVKWTEQNNSRICELVTNNSSPKTDEFTNGQKVLKVAIEHLAGLPADWDNYGFEKISRTTQQSAHNFVHLMLRKKKLPTSVTTDGIGGIIFKWQWQAKKLLVTVKNDRMFYSLRADGEIADHDDNILFEGTYIPPEVQRYIP